MEDKRSPDPRDCTLADIINLGQELKRLFVSHRQGEVVTLTLINHFELLLQSARTRIIVLRHPTCITALTQQELLEKYITAHTFRQIQAYQLFVKQLQPLLIEQGKNWLVKTTVVIKHPFQSALKLSLILIRIKTEPAEGWIINAREDESLKESYRRIKTLMRYLKRYEPYVLGAMMEVLAKKQELPNLPYWTIPPIGSLTGYTPRLALLGVKRELLNPIHEWVERIYKEYRAIPLLQAHHSSGAKIDYNNLFFFVRLNTQVKDGTHQDGFVVGLVVPPSQQKDLSYFFHTQRQSACQWYESQGKCSIAKIKHCLFESVWTELVPDETDQTKIQQAFKSYWERLNKYNHGAPTLAGAAFKTQSIVFERRANKTEAILNGDADKILSCVKSRLVKPQVEPVHKVNKAEHADQRPQLLFVPVYSSSTPLLVLATVVNAERPNTYNEYVTEWQHANYFAGWVLRYIANRFKERMRKAYLGLIADAFAKAYKPLLDASPSAQVLHLFIQQANRGFEDLAKIYPYPKLCLSLVMDEPNVENKEIQGKPNAVFEISPYGHFKVSIDPSDYWQLFRAQYPLFTENEVVRKLRTAMDRVAASETATITLLQRIQARYEHSNNNDCP